MACHQLTTIDTGPISSIKAFGTTFFIVNDRKIAFDLLDKRSARYSDRPSFPFGGEMYVLTRARNLQLTSAVLGLALIVGSRRLSFTTMSLSCIASSFIITLVRDRP